MGKIIDFCARRNKHAEQGREEVLRKVREHVQEASRLLTSMGGDWQQVAWLLEDSMQLVDAPFEFSASEAFTAP